MAGKRINLFADSKPINKKAKDVKKGPTIFEKRAAAKRFAKSKGPSKKQLADSRKKARNIKGLSRVTSPGAIKKEGKEARKKQKRQLRNLSDSPYFRKKLKQMKDLGKTKAEKRGVKTYKPKAKKKKKSSGY